MRETVLKFRGMIAHTHLTDFVRRELAASRRRQRSEPGPQRRGIAGVHTRLAEPGGRIGIGIGTDTDADTDANRPTSLIIGTKHMLDGLKSVFSPISLFPLEGRRMRAGVVCYQ